MKRFVTASLIVFALITAVALGVYSTQNPKEVIPNKAATQSGTSSIVLDSGMGTNWTSGQSGIIYLKVTTPSGTSVDGFQVLVTLTGTIPSDLNFAPSAPPGTQIVLNDFQKTANSATLKVAFITQNPQNPYTADAATLGHFTFTAPASGQMAFTFDNTFTKIVQNGTSQDVAGIPSGGTYTFGAASASPSPTATANPAATATPTPTATPTNAPTSCNQGVQSVTLTPSTQRGKRAQGLTYTVKVKNNDNNCDKANFSLSAILPYSNWSASFAQSVLSIASGSEGSTTVTFTSSSNSPFGTLPVGVNAVGPKSAVVAAANYEVLQSATATPKATAEVINLSGGASPLASASATPIAEVEPITDELVDDKPQGILSQVPTAAIYALGGVLLIVLFFILRSLFGGDKNNPPKITPPTETNSVSDMPPSAPTTSTSMPQQGSEPNTPQISHSIEAPMS